MLVFHLRISESGWAPWLMPAILATWEAKIERIVDLGQPGQKAQPYIQNTQSKKSQKCGSISTAPA
jgi:hypothetical protein